MSSPSAGFNQGQPPSLAPSLQLNRHNATPTQSHNHRIHCRLSTRSCPTQLGACQAVCGPGWRAAASLLRPRPPFEPAEQARSRESEQHPISRFGRLDVI